jgi:hypothetical protein
MGGVRFQSLLAAVVPVLPEENTGRGGMPVILALESSCDETAVAVFDPARGLIGEWVHSQIALHEKHGGVVPDLAMLDSDK